MPAAVIDLGTNTFHLLIAEQDQGKIKVLHRKREFVQIGRNGLDWFSSEVIRDAKTALKKFKSILSSYQVQDLRIIGTSGMRTAKNADEILRFIHETFDQRAEIIDGKREAELIHKGVLLSGISSQITLIVDIGGGSVEFIICRGKELLYSESLQIGIGFLFNTFKPDDPIHPKTYEKIREELSAKLSDLQIALDNLRPECLVGASGTFDLLYKSFSPKSNDKLIPLEPIKQVLEKWIWSTSKERDLEPKIPKNREDYVPIAFSLLYHLLDMKSMPKKIFYSQNTLKEGLLKEIFEL